jgi:hypothetical protein
MVGSSRRISDLAQLFDALLAHDEVWYWLELEILCSGAECDAACGSFDEGRRVDGN